MDFSHNHRPTHTHILGQCKTIIYLVNTKLIEYINKKCKNIIRTTISGGGGYIYSFALELKFINSLLSQATIVSQVSSAVDNYATQSSAIQSFITFNFPDYTLVSIDATAIKNTILVTSFSSEARTLAASLSDVLVMQTLSLSATQIDPNVVFSSLTTQVAIIFSNLMNLKYENSSNMKNS